MAVVVPATRRLTSSSTGPGCATGSEIPPPPGLHKPPSAWQVRGMAIHSIVDEQQIPLDGRPLLASWEGKDHPEQIRLRRYLDDLTPRIEKAEPTGAAPLGLHLDVGLGPVSDLLVYRDLDNFLEPIARDLPDRYCTLQATKSTLGSSSISVGAAAAGDTPPGEGWQFARASGSGSTQSPDWKRALAEQFASQSQLAPDGALDMHITFRVGSSRSWINVWKGGIDSLTPILGHTVPGREFHPRDDRIVNLGLHREIDDALGNDVELLVWWRPSADRMLHDTGASVITSTAVTPTSPPRPPARRAAASSGSASGTVERLDTVEDLREAQGRAGVIVNEDAASWPKIHAPRCTWVTEENFMAKVIEGGGRNGRYWWAQSSDIAKSRWPRAKVCGSCGG